MLCFLINIIVLILTWWHWCDTFPWLSGLCIPWLQETAVFSSCNSDNIQRSLLIKWKDDPIRKKESKKREKCVLSVARNQNSAYLLLSCLCPACKRWAVRSPSLQPWLTPCLWICAGSCDSELSCRLGLSSSGGVKRGCGDRLLITAALYIYLQSTWKLPHRREKKNEMEVLHHHRKPPFKFPS